MRRLSMEGGTKRCQKKDRFVSAPIENLIWLNSVEEISGSARCTNHPRGWSADKSLETCAGWMCELNREHFNSTLPTGEEVLY